MNDDLNIFITIIGTCIDLLLLAIFMWKSHLRYSRIICSFSYIIYALLNIILSLNNIDFRLRMFVNVLSSFLVIKLNYEKMDIIESIKMVVIYYTVLGLGELITIISIMIIMGDLSIENFMEDEKIWALSTLSAKTLSLFMLVIINKIGCDKRKEKFNCFETLLYLFPLVTTFGVLLTILYTLFNIDKIVVVKIMQILLGVGVIMVIYTIFQIIAMTIFIKLKEKNEKIQLLELKNNMQYKIYSERLENEKEIEKLAHDIKNHLIYLQEDCVSDKKEYINSLNRKVTQYEKMLHTNNHILDIILRKKQEEAERLGIDFNVEADFLKGAFIDDVDIVILFGNLIDNALEACNKMPGSDNKAIFISAFSIEEFVAIKIRNTTINKINSINGKLISTKKDKTHHGMGIENVKEIVEKYNGEFVYFCKEGIFEVDILIPLMSN